MHLKSGYCVLYTPIYRLTERKKIMCFHVQNCPCGECEHRLCARAPRARQCSCRIMKNPINYGRNKLNENSKCNYSRKHNCDEVSK